MDMRRNVREPTSTGQKGRRPRCGFLRDESGNTLIEIALTLPFLLTVLIAIWQFGIVYNQMISLTRGATAGAQVLQTDRTATASGSGDPCADTFNAITGAAPTLSSTSISMTITIGSGGTAMTKNSCPGQTLAQGQQVSVQVQYPYNFSIAGWGVATGNMSSGTITETEY